MLSDEKFVACAGFDALAYVRYLGLGMRICAIWGFFSLAIALPTNWTSSNVSRIQDIKDSGRCNGPNPPAACSYSVTSFDDTSLTNVPDNTPRYWAHTVVIVVTALLLLKVRRAAPGSPVAAQQCHLTTPPVRKHACVQMLWHHWKVSLKWRLIYYARTRKGEAAHTVLITDIPGTPQGTILGRIADVRTATARRRRAHRRPERSCSGTRNHEREPVWDLLCLRNRFRPACRTRRACSTRCSPAA